MPLGVAGEVFLNGLWLQQGKKKLTGSWHQYNPPDVLICAAMAGLSGAPEESATALEKQGESYPMKAHQQTYYLFRVIVSEGKSTWVILLSFGVSKGISQYFSGFHARSTRLRLAMSQASISPV